LSSLKSPRGRADAAARNFGRIASAPIGDEGDAGQEEKQADALLTRLAKGEVDQNTSPHG
jgi:hypothetical protein